MFPVAAGRERAAADTADARIERVRSLPRRRRRRWRYRYSLCCGNVREAGLRARGREASENISATSPGAATPIVSAIADLEQVEAGAAGDQPVHVFGFHHALKRTAEGRADRGAATDPGVPAPRRRCRRAPRIPCSMVVPWLRSENASAGYERVVDFPAAGLGRAVEAAPVQDEPDIGHAVVLRHARHHRLGVGHLRHALRVYEARGLQPAHARGHGAPDELQLDLGRQDLGLVLEPVSRRYLDELDAAGGTWAGSPAGRVRGFSGKRRRRHSIEFASEAATRIAALSAPALPRPLPQAGGEKARRRRQANPLSPAERGLGRGVGA